MYINLFHHCIYLYPGLQLSITATNWTSTSVLLQWNGSEGGNCYNVSYALRSTNTDDAEDNGRPAVSMDSITTCEGVSIMNNNPSVFCCIVICTCHSPLSVARYTNRQCFHAA